MASPYCIGIDLGGTNIKLVAVRDDGQVLLEADHPTQDRQFEGDIPKFAINIREMVTEVERNHGPAKGIGLSAPGLAARNHSCIEHIPGKMEGLEGFHWAEFLERSHLVPVLNDAHAALYGEQWLGAAAGVDNVAMLTLGTGVGGAIICDGHLLKGHIGRAGHLGHITVNAHGEKSVTGIPGGLEKTISETFIKTLANPKYPTTKALAEAASAGDTEAAALWRESVRNLAVAMASVINAVDPEVFIIGGGAAKAGAQLFDPLHEFLDEFEWRPGGHKVRVVTPKLGDKAGGFGAARLGRQFA